MIINFVTFILIFMLNFCNFFLIFMVIFENVIIFACENYYHQTL